MFAHEIGSQSVPLKPRLEVPADLQGELTLETGYGELTLETGERIHSLTLVLLQPRTQDPN